jgi:predicted amidohydrolase YtcJ
MLIRNAEIDFGRRVDVRLEAGQIRTIAATGSLPSAIGEPCIDAAGHALLPGLHDHHSHLLALAAALDSLPCGPPQVSDAATLAARLRQQAASGSPEHWLRGIGYHPSVAGDIDRDWLDACVAERPLRIQHRSGRLWIVNSAGLERLLAGGGPPPPGMELRHGRPTGRFFDADDWLRRRLPRRWPSLTPVGALLARHGITGITDATPDNDAAQFTCFATAQAQGELPQDLLIMGSAALDEVCASPGLMRGPTKFHLHEIDLPPFDACVAAIRHSHAAGRATAFHCVTQTELVFALGALNEAGAQPGDRIEHAAVAPPEVVPLLQQTGVTVVTQPNFIFERGDAYLREVAADEQPWLYRLRGLIDAGIAVAGGVDAPFGATDPWAAMQAAVERRSRLGLILGAAEALSPEAALALFLAPLTHPGGPVRRLTPGAPADLCLLDRPWAQARNDLAAVRVRLTFKAGRIIHGPPATASRSP